MHYGSSRWKFPVVAALICLAALFTPLLMGGAAWTPAFLTLAALAAGLAGYLVGARMDTLRALTWVDPLTGLANRRKFDEALKAECARAHREGTPLSVLVLDLDDLKGLNDSLGHAAGDRALQAVAEALKHSCRPADLVARWGGDEFAVVAPGITEDQARGLAERIASTVHLRSADRRPVLELGSPVQSPTLSVSVGVAAADAEHPGLLTPHTLFAAADRALYAAKAEGQGHVQLASGDGRPPRTRASLKLVGSTRGS